MDDFEQSTGVDVCTGEPIVFGEPGLDMDYYDGNTVTALWNYAQHFALGDESFTTTFGSDAPGMLNLVSGDTSKRPRRSTLRTGGVMISISVG